MNRSKATEIIEQHRRRWRSTEPDSVIIRRGERVYLALAIMHVGLAGPMAALLHAASPFARIVLPTGLFVAGAIYFWQSRRFNQIRRILAE